MPITLLACIHHLRGDYSDPPSLSVLPFFSWEVSVRTLTILKCLRVKEMGPADHIRKRPAEVLVTSIASNSC